MRRTKMYKKCLLILEKYKNKKPINGFRRLQTFQAASKFAAASIYFCSFSQIKPKYSNALLQL